MSKENKRVLHINSYFLTSTLHQRLVEKIDEIADVPQDIYCPIDVVEVEPSVPLQGRKGQFFPRKCFNTFHRRIWPLKMLKIWRDFSNWQNGRKFHVVHAHTLVVNGIIAYLYHKRTGTPYIVTVRNTDANRFLLRTPLIKWLLRPVLLKTKNIIFLGPAYWVNNFPQAYPSSFLERIENKVAFIPNGIDDFWHLKLVSKTKELTSSFRILFVGKLNSNKNVDILIKACRKLDDMGIEVILDIVGAGPEEKSLRQSIGNLNVEFHGSVSDQGKLALHYRAADVLAVISKTESFGLVYAEALSQGTPVLYTKGQGFDGVFEEGEVGYSTDPDNLEDVVDKLLLIRKERERLFERVLLVGDKFSWKRSSEEIFRLYNR